ncbi:MULTISPECIES: acylphosphatase [unclassified Guyparkeria]|uniref:acylphosphatase n=1 Tax=unclassified Guyparkeria TaxID=2626246 RepID=UPI00073392FA|nr:MULTISPECIES: acylphosphatase [unclassified Guyparkeria]KTG16861.1 acylphosphatase [Guyparkeria sp. XI15]OAE85895.1 acylphosphatase [Guyparkeria sp. WRN-7]
MFRMHLWVSGRVQGVFFRDFTRRTALEHGLSGWVRNLADGRVEAVLEGARADVEAVTERLRHGPPQAQVEDILHQEEPPEDLKGFNVR